MREYGLFQPVWLAEEGKRVYAAYKAEAVGTNGASESTPVPSRGDVLTFCLWKAETSRQSVLHPLKRGTKEGKTTESFIIPHLGSARLRKNHILAAPAILCFVSQGSR